MPLFDTNIFDAQVEDFGENVTVQSVTISSYSKWGHPTETTSDASSIKAIVIVMSNSDDYVKEGILRAGDIVAYFKSSRTDITRGNRIQYNSNWYEVNEVITHRIIGTDYLFEAKAKKI